jgi:Txe/YoeB family toxin of Txe-Axe toxin-antitoxin module
MKCFFTFLCPIVALLVLQSCGKEDKDNDLQIDPFTYGAKFDWREDSVKTQQEGSWTKIQDGNVFSWLAKNNTLQSTTFGAYGLRTNIKTNFVYTIEKDSVFALRLTADSIYFLDGNGHQRTDVKGKITYSPDTSLVVLNTAVSPGITIKYKLEK